MMQPEPMLGHWRLTTKVVDCHNIVYIIDVRNKSCEKNLRQMNELGG